MSATSQGGGDEGARAAGAVGGDDSGGIGYPTVSTSGKLSSGDPWAVS